MVTKIKRRVMELITDGQSVFTPQVQSPDGTWNNMPSPNGGDLSFGKLEAAIKFFERLPKMEFEVHEIPDETAELKIVHTEALKEEAPAAEEKTEATVTNPVEDFVPSPCEKPECPNDGTKDLHACSHNPEQQCNCCAVCTDKCTTASQS